MTTKTTAFVWAYAQTIKKPLADIPMSHICIFAKNLKRKMQKEGIPLPESVFALLLSHLNLIELGLEPFEIPIEKTATA